MHADNTQPRPVFPVSVSDGVQWSTRSPTTISHMVDGPHHRLLGAWCCLHHPASLAPSSHVDRLSLEAKLVFFLSLFVLFFSRASKRKGVKSTVELSATIEQDSVYMCALCLCYVG